MSDNNLLASRDVRGAVGWKLVPREPTEEMVSGGSQAMFDAAYLGSLSRKSSKNVWSAMLSAAPDQPPIEQPSIPADMVAYGPNHSDYPDAPDDWDCGPALRRSGDCFTPGNGKASPYWQHDGDPKDIIAYTPRPKPSEQPTVRYLSERFDWAAPGDHQRDAWMIRFNDQEHGDVIFDAEAYDDPEAAAWEAWDRYAPAWNCYVFRLARLRPEQPTVRVEISEERIDRAAEALSFGIAAIIKEIGHLIDGKTDMGALAEMTLATRREMARAVITAALGKGDQT